MPVIARSTNRPEGDLYDEAIRNLTAEIASSRSAPCGRRTLLAMTYLAGPPSSLTRHSNLSQIFCKIIIALCYANFEKRARRDSRREELPKNKSNVLRRRNNSIEFRHIVIQMLVIYFGENNFVNEFAKFFEVDHVSCFRIGFPGDGHFDRVIMPVPARVVALIEDALVLFI